MLALVARKKVGVKASFRFDIRREALGGWRSWHGQIKRPAFAPVSGVAARQAESDVRRGESIRRLTSRFSRNRGVLAEFLL